MSHFSHSLLLRLFSTYLWLPLVLATQFEEYILAPSQRSITPRTLISHTGDVLNPDALCTGADNSQGAIFSANSSITLDFGVNIAGTVEFEVRSMSGENEYVGFTFTESSLWISPYLCDSASNATFDGPLWFRIDETRKYGAEKKHQRGGFRYVSIWHNSTGTLTLGSFSVNFTASPEMQDLRAYTGYFNSDDEVLNRVWYAGAYTNQLCSADPTYGNALGVPGNDWYYNATIANGTSVLMDGAKRDRLVWAGDIIISGPASFVSIGILDGVKNAIDSLFVLQQPDGRLPWAGTQFTTLSRFQFSFTYHLYTLLDMYLYYLYSGDTDYVIRYWDQYRLGVSWSLGTIDASGMANVSSTNDWLRSGMGGHNIEDGLKANAILYHTLNMSLNLAKAVEDSSVAGEWTLAMERIRTAVNECLWDPMQSLFYDNDTIQIPSSIHPQDGNSWAVIANLVNTDRASMISTSLMQRWIRPYGAPAPEAGMTISPFASGFEVQAHFLAGFPDRALDLIEFMWGDFMLGDPRMTNSSFIEGYSTNGSLHYSPYPNDARVSHAHGWSTSPTSSMTSFAAGLQLTSAAGETWLIRPKLGKLRRLTAGYKTSLGQFSANWTIVDGGSIIGDFETPPGTLGTLILPIGTATIVVNGSAGYMNGSTSNGTLTFNNVTGGGYKVYII